MKTLIKTASLALVFVFSLFSCNNEDNVSPDQAISNDEAAEEVASFLASDVSAASADLDFLIEDAQNGKIAVNSKIEACGITYDTAINRSFSGAYLTFNYTLQYGYGLSCTNAGIPSTLTYSIYATGNRSGNRLSSQGESEGTLSASGFEVSKSSYLLNGTFSRTHTVSQKAGAQKTFNSALESTLSDISIDKLTKVIQSGFAIVEASGTSSSGGSYTYSASVVFNGNETADVVINSNVYLVNTETGQVSKK